MVSSEKILGKVKESVDCSVGKYFWCTKPFSGSNRDKNTK